MSTGCYVFISTPVTFNEAEADCVAKGLHLASPRSLSLFRSFKDEIYPSYGGTVIVQKLTWRYVIYSGNLYLILSPRLPYDSNNKWGVNSIMFSFTLNGSYIYS